MASAAETPRRARAATTTLPAMVTPSHQLHESPLGSNEDGPGGIVHGVFGFLLV